MQRQASLPVACPPVRRQGEACIVRLTPLPILSPFPGFWVISAATKASLTGESRCGGTAAPSAGHQRRGGICSGLGTRV